MDTFLAYYAGGGGKMQIVGIDVGRNKVKAVSRDKKIAYTSRVGEWRPRKLTNGGDYEIEINGKGYFIADLAAESYFMREMATESKIHEETKVLFIAALVLVADPEEQCMIITGLPISQHTAGEKERLSKLLQGTYYVTLGGVEKYFHIDEIGIVPEGGGAYWDAVLDREGHVNNVPLTEGTVRVIDIGSRTINYCTINNRKYIDRDSGTLNYGILELQNMGDKPEPHYCEGFTRRVLADLSKKWFNHNPGEDIVLFTGGGSILLKQWLKLHFENVIFAEDPVFANALGYYKMGAAKWAAK